MRDMIWFFIDALDLRRALWHDLHPCTGVAPSPRCHHHEASGNVTQLTILAISHQTPRYKTKLDALLLSFACFTWLLGLLHKNRFLPTNMKPQCSSMNCFFDSSLRALCCRCHIHYSWRNWHPTSYFYTVQAVCKSWNQSCVKCVKLVFGPLQSNYATDINKCTWEDNNERINVHILLCVLIIQAYYAYIGSDTTVGVRCK
jgi:hypothetical protein